MERSRETKQMEPRPPCFSRNDGHFVHSPPTISWICLGILERTRNFQANNSAWCRHPSLRKNRLPRKIELRASNIFVTLKLIYIQAATFFRAIQLFNRPIITHALLLIYKIVIPWSSFILHDFNPHARVTEKLMFNTTLYDIMKSICSTVILRTGSDSNR